MTYPIGTMVEVRNDRTPWYGQVVDNTGGSYSIRVGGTSVVVSVAPPYVRLHPTVRQVRPYLEALYAAVVPQVRRPLPILPGGAGVDRIGSAGNNRLPAVLAENDDRGAIVTVANVHALLTLMHPSAAPVIMYDRDQGHINLIIEIIRMGSRATSMLDFYQAIINEFGEPGYRLVLVFLSKHRCRAENLVALKSCAARLDCLQADFAVAGTAARIRTIAERRAVKIGILYVSDIEMYVENGSSDQVGTRALFRQNALELMDEGTILIRGASPNMDRPVVGPVAAALVLPQAAAAAAAATVADVPSAAAAAAVAPGRRRPGGLKIQTHF